MQPDHCELVGRYLTTFRRNILPPSSVLKSNIDIFTTLRTSHLILVIGQLSPENSKAATFKLWILLSRELRYILTVSYKTVCPISQHCNGSNVQGCSIIFGI
jgi:hypothetical protein